MARLGDAPVGRSEYGGGSGTPQTLPDGSRRDLRETTAASGVRQRARLARAAGLADFDAARTDAVGLVALVEDGSMRVEDMNAAELIQYEIDIRRTADRVAERERLVAGTNGYIEDVDTYAGDEVAS